MGNEVKGKELTFWEATSIIIGHGVGSGILSVPFLASRNSIRDILITLAVVYFVNLLLHLMIAELSYNNNGAQFVKCFENELFKGKAKKVMTWVVFAFLGLSVLVNVSGFIAGSAAVFNSWFGLPTFWGMIVYYVIVALVVNFGLKFVGICEKISIDLMIGVVGILFVATMLATKYPLPNSFISFTNIIALYSMVSFSLSAVMSVPQVVKGLNKDIKKIRGAIATGTGVNVGLIVVITFMTLIGAGNGITENGALVDLASHLGGWVAVVGYVFSLLALSTSFWANTLNLRDIVNEQVHIGERKSWLISSLPCLILALVGAQSFVAFTRLASVIQVLTGIGIIISYNRSRKKNPSAPIIGKFGIVPFQVIVVVSSVMATLGALLKVK